MINSPILKTNQPILHWYCKEKIEVDKHGTGVSDEDHDTLSVGWKLNPECFGFGILNIYFKSNFNLFLKTHFPLVLKCSLFVSLSNIEKWLFGNEVSETLFNFLLI